MSNNPSKLLIITIFFVSAFFLSFMLINDLSSKKDDKSLVNLPTLAPSGLINPTPTIAQNLISTDQMVNCNIDINCGGGAKYISKEACLNSTCCLLGDKFIQYDDKNKCLYDRVLLSGSGSASFTPVNVAAYVSTYNAYIYCKPEAVSQIKELDKIVKEWIEKVRKCSSGTQYDYSNCLKNCTDINSWPICSQNCRDKSSISACDAFKEYPLNNLNNAISASCG